MVSIMKDQEIQLNSLHDYKYIFLYDSGIYCITITMEQGSCYSFKNIYNRRIQVNMRYRLNSD